MHPDLIEKLSPRQREVLQLMARGLTNKEIAGVFGISPETVRTHVAAVLSRLEVSNRTEAATAYLVGVASADRVAQILTRPAISVLPVLVDDDDLGAAAFAAGITRDLTTLISRWCWFPVIANASTRDVRSLGRDSREIGALLGARFLIDATLRIMGTDWRITVNVVDTNAGHCLWANNYDFPRGALFRVQDDICQRIVASIYPRLIATIYASLPRGQSPESFDAWEQANGAFLALTMRTREANVRAQADFRAALEREPTLVLAAYGLGLTYYYEILNQWGPEASTSDQIIACAERCIALAPHMAEGYVLAGRAHQARGRHDLAVSSLQIAIGHNPSFASAHALLGQVLLLAGQTDEGLLRMQHACRLDPNSYVAGLATAHFVRREYLQALDAAELALVNNPGYPFARALALASAWWTGDRQRAAAHHRALVETEPAFSPHKFKATFGSGVESVCRIAQALEGVMARS